MEYLKEVLGYVESQIKLFEELDKGRGNFEGVIAGMQLVKAYLKTRLEHEGKQIAEALDVKV